MERELSLARSQIMHPETVNGKRLWVDPEVKEIVDLMQNGDPTLGWEGDPRLALYRGPDDRWEVWRLEGDGEYRLVCRSLPGGKLDRGLIIHLRAHDLRRIQAEELLKAIDAHNDAVLEAKNHDARDRANEALAEATFLLGKEVGHHY